MLEKKGVDTMHKDRRILQWLTENPELPGERIPGQSLLELAADRRVLIENHGGVTQYSRSRIGIKVRFGQILVCGCNLELARMTKEQLVITGRIESITLTRRDDR